MNNLKYLRENANLSLRKLSKMVGISDSLLSLLENEKRMWRLSHINALTNFFKVTSDFLLGKSEMGIYVDLSSGFVSINKKDYIEYKANSELTEIIVENQIMRVPVKSLEEKLDPLINKDIRDLISKKLDELSHHDLEQVLKLINLFL